MTSGDPAAAAARTAATRLAARHGPGLPADVEAALATRGTSQRPGQFLDPVSLGGLIVAIATLAWTIYTDKRKHTPDPPPALIAHQVRMQLRDHASTHATADETNQIIEILITEITTQAAPPNG